MTDEEIYYDENWNIIDKPLDSDEPEEEKEQCVDCNGTPLSDGDTIIAIKWLAVKWGTDIKKWDKFTNVRLWDDITHVSCNSKKNGKIFLKTEYFKLNPK